MSGIYIGRAMQRVQPQVIEKSDFQTFSLPFAETFFK